jgi:acyl-CoA thioester hydrolase
MSQPPEAGAWEGAVHRLPVRVYYEDTDFTGVVYYANYLKFFERGRTDALRTAGVGHAELWEAEPRLGFAVRKITVEYRLPARIDDALIVETAFTRAKGARFEVRQRILCGDAELAHADVVAACIDAAGRPARLPKSVLQALASKVSS